MNISWRYLVFALALLVLIGLGLFFPSVAITYIIGPVSIILWAVVRMVLMFDQSDYWAVLVFVAFIIGLRLIPWQREPELPPSYTYDSWYEDRVTYWERLLRIATETSTGRLALQRELESMVRSIGALMQNDEQQEIYLPPVKPVLPHTFLYRLLHRKEPFVDKEFEKSVEAALRSIETKLEIHHDHSSDTPHDR